MTIDGKEIDIRKAKRYAYIARLFSEVDPHAKNIFPASKECEEGLEKRGIKIKWKR